MDLGIDGIGDATEIDEGASATVYRAAQRGRDREVAVKVLVRSDADFVGRFRSQVELVERLGRSQRVVTVHDTGVTRSGRPYVVLQLCRGSLLDRVERDGRIEPVEACRIMAGVAAGIADAHELQVVHGHLQPGNILISEEGEYLVSDLDTSVVPEATLTYEPSFGVDVYALGATLFHLVSGAAPFAGAGADIVTVADRAAEDAVPDLRAQGVPANVCDLIELAMAEKPDDRPTVDGFRTALESIVSPLLFPGLRLSHDPASQEIIDAAPGPQPGPAIFGVDRSEVERPTVEASALWPAAASESHAIIVSRQEPLADGFSGPVGSNPVQVLGETVVSGSIERNRVAADIILGRMRPRHLVVALSALLVLVIGAAAVFSLTSGSDGGGEIAAEPRAPLVIDEPEARSPGDDDEQSGRRPSSAAGAAGEDALLDDDRTAATVSQAEQPPEDSVPASPAPTTGSTRVRIPAVAGIAEADARSQLLAAGLVAGTTSLTFSAVVGRGLVIGTSPSGRVAPGSSVDLVVSRGPAVAVPDVTSLTQAAATAQLTALGLIVTTRPGQSGSVPAGSVISSSPPAAMNVEEGSSVQLVIAEDSRPAVPVLAGRTVPEASALLSAANLQLGATSNAYDDQVAAGLIISSTPSGGTKVDAGSSVAVVISLGGDSGVCDGLVGMPEFVAVAAVVAVGLTPQVTTESSTVHPAGIVIDCDEELPNGTVLLTVSLGPPILVPNVVGLTQTQAELMLMISGIPYTVIDVFGSQAVGIVVSMSPPAGSKVETGMIVELSVSRGPEPEEGGGDSSG